MVLHSWDISFKEATELQKSLSQSLILNCPLPHCIRVAAVDISYNRGNPLLHAAALIYDIHAAQVVEKTSASSKVAFPYRSGYLAFRELPLILRALEQLKTTYQAVLVDGQGIAHPRGLGIASHLGLWLKMPTIGCAKSRLYGTGEEPGFHRGNYSLMYSPRSDYVVAAAVRTRSNIKPIYISQGHLCDLRSAVDLVLKLSKVTRLPIPNQMAHCYANRVRKDALLKAR